MNRITRSNIQMIVEQMNTGYIAVQYWTGTVRCYRGLIQAPKSVQQFYGHGMQEMQIVGGEQYCFISRPVF